VKYTSPANQKQVGLPTYVVIAARGAGIWQYLAQRAFQLSENGDVEYPGGTLDEIRPRFLMFGVRAPFG
jgi:hypothetical protein